MNQLVDEAGLVARAQAGEQVAFATLHDAYFPALYDFVVRVTRDPVESQGIVHDAFLRAMTTLGGLPATGSFPGWLFGIARNAALARLRSGARAQPVAGANFELVDAAKRGSGADAIAFAELAGPVWRAASRLDPRQLSLLDLHVRQGLDSADIAAALGITPENGAVIVERLKIVAGDSIAASLAGESGREPAVAPLDVFASLAAVQPPEGAGEANLASLLGRWPGPATMRPAAARPAAPAATPGVAGPFAAGFVRTGGALGLAAALLAVALLVPASPLSLTRDDKPRSTLAAFPGDGTPATPRSLTPTPTRTAGAAAPTPSRTLPAVGTSPSPSNSVGVTTSPTAPAATSSPAPTSTSAATQTATLAPPSSTPGATATVTPCVPTLGTFSGPLTLPPGGASSFSLVNLQFCGSATYSLAVDSTWLAVAPGNGTIAAGGSAPITVTVDGAKLPPGEATYVGNITVNGPGGQSFAMTVTSVRGGAAPVVSLLSGSCSPTSATLSVRVSASDDIGIASVTLGYVHANGTSGGQAMALTTGTAAGGTWEATVTMAGTPPGVTSYSVTATDGAGHTGGFSHSC